MNVDQIAARINDLQPDREWHMQCQALMYWAGVAITDDWTRWTYGRAIWAYNASEIVSLDPLAAPAGSLHYWLYPVGHGHVALELGGGRVLMTGTPHELGAARHMLGNDYGSTTVASFMSRGTQKYLGWSYTNGTNASLTPYFVQPEPEKPEPPPRKGKKMLLINYKNAPAGERGREERWAFVGSGFWLELVTKATVVKFKRQLDMKEDSFEVKDDAVWDRFKASAAAGMTPEGIALLAESVKALNER